jgi:hypothetical protein
MVDVESLLSKGKRKNNKPCEAWWLFSICKTETKGSMSKRITPASSTELKNNLFQKTSMC